MVSDITHKVRRVMSLLRKGLVSGPLIRFRIFSKRVHGVIAHVASKNGFIASLYFTFFSRKLYREHKAVLQGVVAQRRANIGRQKTSAHLRRNIHRIEKGLIMRPRRESFAEAYIMETVQLFRCAEEGGTLCRDEMKWANDVLSLYFRVVSHSPKIKAARGVFLPINDDGSSCVYVPYRHDTVPDSGITYDQLHILYTRRRSVRWYLDRPVEEHLVNKAVRAASLAPSACNRQPFTFHVLYNKEQARKVAKMAGGTAGYSGNIPCLIVVVGDLASYAEVYDRHLIYIDSALASMQLMLALETLGLSSCPINWPDIEQCERAIQKELGLKDYERPIMQISIGYADPDGGIPYSQKKDDNLLICRPKSD